MKWWLIPYDLYAYTKGLIAAKEDIVQDEIKRVRVTSVLVIGAILYLIIKD